MTNADPRELPANVIPFAPYWAKRRARDIERLIAPLPKARQIEFLEAAVAACGGKP